jgi:GNAT superfamily N-acetyltransferase
MTIDLTPFVDFAAEMASQNLVRWCGKEDLRADVWESFAADVRRRTADLDWARGYATRCPVAQAEPREYQLRILDLGVDGKVLAGIHFFGLDVDRPFVGLTARTKPLDSREQVARMANRMYDEFARFSPQSMWVYQSVGSREFRLEGIPDLKPDIRLVAGSVTELQTRPVPPFMDRIDLAHAKSMDFWEEYQLMYERLHAERPALRHRVNVTERDLMERCASAGGLFKVLVDGEWAGIFTGLPTREHGLRGYLVVEEVLDTPYRGHGLGPALQRHFIDQLPVGKGDLVFGTIDATNRPSIRTAIKVGRADVGGWSFVPIQREASV